jgi:hypothetical protein
MMRGPGECGFEWSHLETTCSHWKSAAASNPAVEQDMLVVSRRLIAG